VTETDTAAELLPGQERCGNCYHFAGDGPDPDGEPYRGTGRCEVPGFVGFGRHLDSYWYCDNGQFRAASVTCTPEIPAGGARLYPLADLLEAKAADARKKRAT